MNDSVYRENPLADEIKRLEREIAKLKTDLGLCFRAGSALSFALYTAVQPKQYEHPDRLHAQELWEGFIIRLATRCPQDSKSSDVEADAGSSIASICRLK
jgi:hypothetical protein